MNFNLFSDLHLLDKTALFILILLISGKLYNFKEGKTLTNFNSDLWPLLTIIDIMKMRTILNTDS